MPIDNLVVRQSTDLSSSAKYLRGTARQQSFSTGTHTPLCAVVWKIKLDKKHLPSCFKSHLSQSNYSIHRSNKQSFYGT